MGVTVLTDEDAEHYAEANRWHIDQHGTLHVIRATQIEQKSPGHSEAKAENVAAYPMGAWLTVRLEEIRPPAGENAKAYTEEVMEFTDPILVDDAEACARLMEDHLAAVGLNPIDGFHESVTVRGGEARRRIVARVVPA